MTEDEAQIGALIEDGRDAAHRGDLDGVLASHTGDILMFDVLSPNEVNGIETTNGPGRRSSSVRSREPRFDIVSLEVTAGADVAFATASLRCGTNELDGSWRRPMVEAVLASD